ncbi:9908_t:CDS:2 [Acaulospora morrowiae]|uniref:9908_t:CDS:1 n=1 Tax=Acaulospora morrowiae TaxID=94023 RepID=A0A9N8Z8R1_9GLOM|nr:9908_t:CDS:2 [Acaulospora morrowiae]
MSFYFLTSLKLPDCRKITIRDSRVERLEKNNTDHEARLEILELGSLSVSEQTRNDKEVTPEM